MTSPETINKKAAKRKKTSILILTTKKVSEIKNKHKTKEIEVISAKIIVN